MPTPFDRYVAPARDGRATPARVSAGAAFVVAAVLAAASLARPAALSEPPWDAAWALPAQLGVIACGLPALALALALLHGRALGALFGPTGAPRLGAALLAAGVAATLSLASVPAAVALGLGRIVPAAPNAPSEAAALALLATLALLPLQCAAEEALFRGYLLQNFAAMTRRAVVWAGLPALLFALVHLDPTAEPAAMGARATSALAFALVATALVVRFGGLSAAIGAHLGLNAAALLGVDGAFGPDGPALWRFEAAADASPWLSAGLDGALFAALYLALAALLAPERPT